MAERKKPSLREQLDEARQALDNAQQDLSLAIEQRDAAIKARDDAFGARDVAVNALAEYYDLDDELVEYELRLENGDVVHVELSAETPLEISELGGAVTPDGKLMTGPIRIAVPAPEAETEGVGDGNG